MQRRTLTPTPPLFFYTGDLVIPEPDCRRQAGRHPELWHSAPGEKVMHLRNVEVSDEIPNSRLPGGSGAPG